MAESRVASHIRSQQLSRQFRATRVCPQLLGKAPSTRSLFVSGAPSCSCLSHTLNCLQPACHKTKHEGNQALTFVLGPSWQQVTGSSQSNLNQDGRRRCTVGTQGHRVELRIRTCGRGAGDEEWRVGRNRSPPFLLLYLHAPSTQQPSLFQPKGD